MPAEGPSGKKGRSGYNNYLRYSALGFQMAGIILVGVLAGRWLDGKLHWAMPICTLVLSLLSIAGAMLFLFKETGRKG